MEKYIVLFSIVVLCTIYLAYVIKCSKDIKNFNRESYKNEIKKASKVINELGKKKMDQLNEEEQKKFLQSKAKHETEIKTLENMSSEIKQKYNKDVAKYEEELKQLYSQKSKEEAQTIQNIVEYYAGERQRIQEDFDMFNDNIKQSREELKIAFEREKNRQDEIIEQYRRAEQIKQNKDYYRIVLSENNVDDVQKLRKMAKELHDPAILYKLIYKEYYEKPFNEMVGRVTNGTRGNVGIYKITNLENGRVYVGQTKQTFKERWRTHLKRGVKAEAGTMNKLYDAMWQDGPENFTFEILSECDVAELNQKEKEYIALYKANTWGYNSNAGVG